MLAAATGADEAQLREDGQPPAARAELPADRPDRERDARAGHRGLGARASSCPASIYQEVPSRRYPASDMAAHLFGYVSEVTEAQLQRADYKGLEPGAIVGQAGVEHAYNKLLMGIEGKRRRRQQPRPRDPTCSARIRPTVGRRCSSRSTPTCRRRPRTASHASRGFNGAAVVLDPRTGEVLTLHQPAGLRPERVRRRHRARDLGRAEHRSAEAAAEPRAAGHVFAGLDVQDGGRRRRRSRRA